MTTPHYADGSVTLYHGDCVELLRRDEIGYDSSLSDAAGRLFADASIDAVVTDPPYGLEFMGRDWDGADGFRRSFNPAAAGRDSVFGRTSRTSPEYGTTAGGDAQHSFEGWCRTWATECLRVLKPGGYLVAFGGARTFHRLTCAIEDTGFEIRDPLAWIHGQGFPKSRNLDDDWDGWGTALKPSYEPIVCARKPLAGSVAENVQLYGTGAFNIDGCRIHSAGSEAQRYTVKRLKPGSELNRTGGKWRPESDGAPTYHGHTKDGRWPTNVVFDESRAAELDRQSGTTTSRIRPPRRGISGDGWGMTASCTEYDDAGGASRFFPVFRYHAKAGVDERPCVNGIQHPTVKPLGLCRWLVRLVTPPNGVVLDPFSGSGTIAEASIHEHKRCIAIEREPDYLPLIVQRLTKPMEIGFDFDVPEVS